MIVPGAPFVLFVLLSVVRPRGVIRAGCIVPYVVRGGSVGVAVAPWFATPREGPLLALLPCRSVLRHLLHLLHMLPSVESAFGSGIPARCVLV